jgi:hypothetical protein
MWKTFVIKKRRKLNMKAAYIKQKSKYMMSIFAFLLHTNKLEHSENKYYPATTSKSISTDTSL